MPLLGRHAALRQAAASVSSRPLHTTALRANGRGTNVMPDLLDERKATGRTGGGEPLNSSTNAPGKPKVSNLAVPMSEEGRGLNEEQKREVDKHNSDFVQKHDRSEPAPKDKVNKKYWTGETRGRS